MACVCTVLLVGLANVCSADTTTSGGVQQGVRVQGQLELPQNAFDTANDLHFKVWQKEDDINVNGWRVEVSGFAESSSDRGEQPEPAHSRTDRSPNPDNGQHAVDVDATYPDRFKPVRVFLIVYGDAFHDPLFGITVGQGITLGLQK